MYCTKCGKEISDNDEFCKYCGNKNISSNESPLITACKKCVIERLKAPSTAKFNIIDIKDVDSYGRIFYYVEVDSQNSFGASLRTKLYVVLQKVEEDSSYIALKEAVYKVSFINTADVVKRLNKWNKPL